MLGQLLHFWLTVQRMLVDWPMAEQVRLLGWQLLVCLRLLWSHMVDSMHTLRCNHKGLISWLLELSKLVMASACRYFLAVVGLSYRWLPVVRLSCHVLLPIINSQLEIVVLRMRI